MTGRRNTMDYYDDVISKLPKYKYDDIDPCLLFIEMLINTIEYNIKKFKELVFLILVINHLPAAIPSVHIKIFIINNKRIHCHERRKKIIIRICMTQICMIPF